MQIKPLRDRILVTKEDLAEKTPSGLYIPTSRDENILLGKVTCTGNGKITSDGTLVPLEVKVGDKIAFDKRYAQELKIDGENFLMLSEENILCIIS